MSWRLLRHEWRLLSGDGALRVALAVFAVAIAYGTYNGTAAVAFQRAALAEAAREEGDRFAQHEASIARIAAGELKVSAFADPRNPQSAGSRLAARYAVLPPSPLAALSIGQSDLLPAYFKVTSDSRQNVTAGYEIENPHRLLIGRFDLAFVLIYLYPLLILAISYNVLSGEKEGGTLALVLSQPVSLRALTIAKLSLRFSLFVMSVAALGVAAVLAAGIDFLEGANIMRLGLWLAAVAAYGSFWFALAILVIAAGRSSSTNAMLLAAAWLMLVVLGPALLNMIVTIRYPVPSRVEMIQAVRAASDEANAQGSIVLAKYYEDHPDLSAGSAEQVMSDFNLLRIAVDADVERRVAPVLARYEAQLAGQRKLAGRMRVLSPAILMQDALNDISGTGTARHARFVEQVGAFHDGWRAHFVDLIVKKAQLTDYHTVPEFRYEEEPFADVRRRVAISLGNLAVLATLMGAYGLWTLRSFQVA